MDGIKRPQLVVDRQKCTANIRSMFAKAQRHNMTLRPHFKTHQSAEVGEIYRREGIECITVSSVRMAQFFSDHGWDDITIAFPVNLREIDEVRQLNQRIRLNLLVESPESARYLNDHLDSRVNVYIKIDTGYRRTGIDWRDTAELERLQQQIADAPKLHLSGLLVHNGHTYDAANVDEILEINRTSIQRMIALREIAQKYQSEVRVSIGDTPSCSLSEDFAGVDEMRPGNFVFYDLQQRQIGSCAFEQIALIVVCPVVAVHRKEAKIVVYGGAVHLSKQGLQEDGRTIYGRLVQLTGSGWGSEIEDTFVASVSQEHGIIHSGSTEFISEVKPGDLVGIVPVHACLAANLLSDIYFV